MGWCSGGELADDLWETVRKHLPKKKLQEIARSWVEIFENRDCDVMIETRVGEDAGIETTDEEGSHFPWQKQ